jgi:hypothetical protein
MKQPGIRECAYCGEKFTANRHQKYCSSDHKLADFYKRRGFEKAHYEAIIEEKDERIMALESMVSKYIAYIEELKARNELLANQIEPPSSKPTSKKPRAKVAT